MSTVKLMANSDSDSNELAAAARSAKRSALWHGILEGFGGPALMGLNSESVRYSPKLAAAYRHIFRSAFQPPHTSSPPHEADREVVEAVYKAIAEAIDKHQLTLEQILEHPDISHSDSKQAFSNKIEQLIRNRHGDR